MVANTAEIIVPTDNQPDGVGGGDKGVDSVEGETNSNVDPLSIVRFGVNPTPLPLHSKGSATSNAATPMASRMSTRQWLLRGDKNYKAGDLNQCNKTQGSCPQIRYFLQTSSVA